MSLRRVLTPSVAIVVILGLIPALASALTIFQGHSAETVACGGSVRSVFIDGAANRVTITGTCTTIEVSGDHEQVTAHAAATLLISGDNETVHVTTVSQINVSGSSVHVYDKRSPSGGSTHVANSPPAYTSFAPEIRAVTGP